MVAPAIEPSNLLKILFLNSFGKNDIIKILPHVKNITPWNPINISDIAKLNIDIGIYFFPRIAGT